MNKRIKADDLPEFDAAPYLESEATIAAYLADILQPTMALYWQARLAILPAFAA